MENRDKIPAMVYRDAVRQLCIQYNPTPGKDIEEDFYEYIHFIYENNRPPTETSTHSKADSEEKRSTRFVMAAGLLSYGNIDVADDLLDCIPPGLGSVRLLARALTALLPVPEHFDPLLDPEPIRHWIREKRDQLIWSPTYGKFIWRDDAS